MHKLRICIKKKKKGGWTPNLCYEDWSATYLECLNSFEDSVSCITYMHFRLVFHSRHLLSLHLFSYFVYGILNHSAVTKTVNCHLICCTQYLKLTNEDAELNLKHLRSWKRQVWGADKLFFPPSVCRTKKSWGTTWRMCFYIKKLGIFWGPKGKSMWNLKCISR